MDKTMIVMMVCLGVYGLHQLFDKAIVPMFNAYLEYRRDIRMHEQDLSMYQVQLNEKGLQRNIDEPDIKQRSGKSDEGTSVHDEELSL